MSIWISSGLGFRPHPPADNVESTLIWYNGTKQEDFQHWQTALDDFLHDYKQLGTVAGRGSNLQECDYKQYPERGRVCPVRIEKFGSECTLENHYGYHKTSPCIFLKLNKIYDWEPYYYEDPSELPEKMPKQLKEKITNITLSKSPEVSI